LVVHSAFALSAEDQARLGVKVAGYLHKPVSPPQLLSAVRGVLGSDDDG
jgi:CheY-like chemotaxis protein